MNPTQLQLAGIAAKIQAADSARRIGAALRLWSECKHAVTRECLESMPSIPELCDLAVSLSGGVDPHLEVEAAILLWRDAGKSIESTAQAASWQKEKRARAQAAMAGHPMGEESIGLEKWLKKMLPGKQTEADRLGRFRRFLKAGGLPPRMISDGAERQGHEKSLSDLRIYGLDPFQAAELAVKFQQWEREFKAHNRSKRGNQHTPKITLGDSEATQKPIKQKPRTAKGHYPPIKRKSGK
jgi:hypothetical protein